MNSRQTYSSKVNTTSSYLVLSLSAIRSAFSFKFLLVAICLLSMCVNTTLASDATRSEKDMLKKAFLSHFGFERVPRLPRTALPVPDHVWDIYNGVHQQEADVETITHYYPKELLDINSGLLLSYNLSVAARNAGLQQSRAELRVHLQRRKSRRDETKRNESNSQDTTMRIHLVDPVSNRFIRQLDSKAIDISPDSSTPKWFVLDVSSALQYASDLDQMRFHIDLPEECDLFVSPTQSISSIPFARIQSAALIVYRYSNEPSRVRRKRSLPSPEEAEAVEVAAADESDSEAASTSSTTTAPTRRRQHRKGAHTQVHTGEVGMCSKREMYVDFEELGWSDWILAPKGYEAGQCMGTCPNPMPDHLNATNHAIIQSLLHSINPDDVPPPCCVPTYSTPLAILYVDEDNKIMIKNYEDMRVETCGCR